MFSSPEVYEWSDSISFRSSASLRDGNWSRGELSRRRTVSFSLFNSTFN
jgi:hypothetical protein